MRGGSVRACLPACLCVCAFRINSEHMGPVFLGQQLMDKGGWLIHGTVRAAKTAERDEISLSKNVNENKTTLSSQGLSLESAGDIFFTF